MTRIGSALWVAVTTGAFSVPLCRFDRREKSRVAPMSGSSHQRALPDSGAGDGAPPLRATAASPASRKPLTRPHNRVGPPSSGRAVSFRSSCMPVRTSPLLLVLLPLALAVSPALAQETEAATPVGAPDA